MVSSNNYYVRDISAESCYEWDLKALSEKEAKIRIADAEILSEFKKRKLIADTIKDSWDLPDGECSKLMDHLGSYARLSIEKDDKEEKTSWKAEYDAALKQLDTVKCK